MSHTPGARPFEPDAESPSLAVMELGTVPYADAWRFQKTRHAAVLAGEITDTLLLLEHNPVVTLGLSGENGHLHVPEAEYAARGIDLFRVERGGKATYHGPGQLVAYPVLRLRDHDLHAYVERLLDVLSDTVAHFGLVPQRSLHGPGLWVGGGKIASVGMAVRKWTTYHGVALNVCPDLTPFSLITPCGNPDERMTSMQMEGCSASVAEVAQVFLANFVRAFGYRVEEDVPNRHPAWLVRRPPGAETQRPVETLLDDLSLHTVCQEAHCPNRRECFAKGTSTFLVMGDTCTRACRYCAVHKGHPQPLDPDEPDRVARAVERLGLRAAVVTSVTRDDVPDGGASHFAAIVNAIRARRPGTLVEVLVPDFGGDLSCVDTVCDARPDMFNHNIETVRRLFASVRPRADYDRSLAVLARAAERGLRVKSGVMLGLGETWADIRATLEDLLASGCRYLTLGQYLAPSSAHVPMARFLAPDEFAFWSDTAKDMGFLGVASAPLVRSSYRAADMLAAAV